MIDASNSSRDDETPETFAHVAEVARHLIDVCNEEPRPMPVVTDEPLVVRLIAERQDGQP